MGLMQAVGTAVQGFAKQEELGNSLADNLRNQRLSNQAAADAIARGSREAGIKRLEASQRAGRQAVAYAASGVDASNGSPLSAMADSRMMSELDALTLENNALREAWGYKRQAEQFGRAADMDGTRQNYNVAGTILSFVGAGASGGGMGF